jgi:hypothetical protein
MLILLVFVCLTSTRLAFALDATVGTELSCKDWLEARDKLNTWIHGRRRGLKPQSSQEYLAVVLVFRQISLQGGRVVALVTHL